MSSELRAVLIAGQCYFPPSNSHRRHWRFMRKSVSSACRAIRFRRVHSRRYVTEATLSVPNLAASVSLPAIELSPRLATRNALKQVSDLALRCVKSPEPLVNAVKGALDDLQQPRRPIIACEFNFLACSTGSYVVLIL